jgi:hypothetical protein
MAIRERSIQLGKMKHLENSIMTLQYHLGFQAALHVVSRDCMLHGENIGLCGCLGTTHLQLEWAAGNTQRASIIEAV